jgi:hypothetical protein
MVLTSMNLSSVDSALAITAGLDENPLDIISGATVSAVDFIPFISVQYSAYAITASSAVSAQLALLSFTAFCRSGAVIQPIDIHLHTQCTAQITYTTD